MKKSNFKSAVLAKGIARELFKCEVNNKIPTTAELAGMFSVGFGTVDKAMNALKDSGAIRLQSKGQLGTILLEKNVAALWSIVDYGALVGSLPLPNTIEFEGLATGLLELFSENHVTCNLTYKNGASLRVNQLLDNKCDFAMLSYLSAVRALEQHPNLRTICLLDDHSYYGDLIIIRRKGDLPEMGKWRIGLDRTSYDHIASSDELFAQNEKINVHYGNIPYLIAEGVIDAAVWHSTQLVPAALIDQLTIQSVENLEAGSGKSMSAVIIANENQKEVITILEEICDAKKIGMIQKEVISRKRSPAY
jgi:hypothetical protein